VSYTPSNMPTIQSIDDLRGYIERELETIAKSLNETTALELRPVFVEPARKREGMIVFADGVSWNPGGGKGAYQYSAGAWVKL
jgi:hypothetical protein